MRKGEDACRSVLHVHTGKPLGRALFARYFEKLYHSCDLDAQGIGVLLKVDGKTLAVNFRTAAEKFKLIEDEDSAPVIVLYRGEDGRDETIDMLLKSLKKQGPERWMLRKLQRYTVNIPRRDALRLLAQDDVTEVIPGLFLQVNDWLYHDDLGLLMDGSPPSVPASII